MNTYHSSIIVIVGRQLTSPLRNDAYVSDVFFSREKGALKLSRAHALRAWTREVVQEMNL